MDMREASVLARRYNMSPMEFVEAPYRWRSYMRGEYAMEMDLDEERQKYDEAKSK